MPAPVTVQAADRLFGAMRIARAGANLEGLRRMTMTTLTRPALRALALCFALSPAGVGAAEIGVYRWDAPGGPAKVDAFEAWLGRPVQLAEAFEARDTWDNIDGAAWQLGPWSQWVRAKPGRNLILGYASSASDLAKPCRRRTCSSSTPRILGRCAGSPTGAESAPTRPTALRTGCRTPEFFPSRRSAAISCRRCGRSCSPSRTP
jgi:hypothetical protein